MILAKICILGEISVGKTSLVRRFVDREFSDAYLSTVGVKISRKLLKLAPHPGGEPVETQLVLWDIEGAHGFREISGAYLRGARGAVIVGDLTRGDTLEAIGMHIQHFRTVNPHGIVIVALNKADLRHDAAPASPGRWEGQEGVLATLHTSARTGDGVDQLFEQIGTYLHHRPADGSALQ